MYFNYKKRLTPVMFVSKYEMKNPLLSLHEPINQSFSYFHIFLIQFNFIECKALCYILRIEPRTKEAWSLAFKMFAVFKSYVNINH